MQCQACQQNTATIHLTEINNGQRLETHLCEACAQKQGIAVKNQIPLNELLSTLLAVQAETKTGPLGLASADLDSACPLCGMTLKEFSENSLLGCPHDYHTFKKQLTPLIEKAHDGHIKHKGKTPKTLPNDTKNQVELINLQQQLDHAVKKEDYETAAKIRDKIKELDETG
jgi:protein arginine kinase activator